MDLFAKHLLSGKTKKVKAMESQYTMATNIDEEANYVNSEVVVEESKESILVESEKLDSSVDASDKKKEKEEKDEPMLRKQKKKQSHKKFPPPPPVEVEDIKDAEIVTNSEQEASEHFEYEQHEFEHAESEEEKQEGSKESESKGTTSGSPSTEQQDDEEFLSRGRLIKYLYNQFDARVKDISGADLDKFRAALDKVKIDIGVLQ
ncbi:nucleolar protein 58-like [Capsicum annuum]|uniref:nucleolar protein 58-like n=1 Tax=Capsicum annuum TaxID=4072 RepID=UPI001FB0D95B|nr:nucleolar protein 58-like [Capsicum annuum]